MTKQRTVKKAEKKESAPPADLLSLTRLAAELHVDRNTLSRKAAALAHVAGPQGARLYSRRAVEELLAADDDPELAEARRRKVAAEAELLELRLQREREEVVPVAEVRDYALKLFRALHQRVGVRFRREVAAQLYRAESPAQITEVLQHELGRIFNELRDDHPKFLAEEKQQQQQEGETDDAR